MRLIDDEGQMVGVMSSDEALRFAESRGLDLIEIAPNANPPTCKVMDYGKWKYEAKKKEKESRKNQTIVTIKEIQIRPRTDDHDLDVKLKHARKFLLEGDKVKLNLRFSGREMAHQELGYELLKDVSQRLSEIATVEAEPFGDVGSGRIGLRNAEAGVDRCSRLRHNIQCTLLYTYDLSTVNGACA